MKNLLNLKQLTISSYISYLIDNNIIYGIIQSKYDMFDAVVIITKDYKPLWFYCDCGKQIVF